MSGTLYPGAKDDNTSLPNPGATDSVNNSNPLLAHNYQHDTENDAIKAIESKLGVGATTPASTGQVLYASAAGISTWGNLPIGGDLTGTLPNPVLASSGVGAGTYGSATQIPVITVDGKGRLTSASTVTATGGGGGTASSPLTTKGDIWGFSSVDARIPIGTDTYVLTADSSQTLGLKWAPAATGTGSVTTVSVASANGFAGTVANATTTPALTLSTTITGIVKGNGTAISAATSGTDYSGGTSGLATGILKSTTTTGALTIAIAADFPTLNQNTTGSAATLTTARTIGTLTGDVTSAGSTFNGSATNTNATVVGKINGVALSGLATGILKNTTTTGVPSIAVAADFPTLNQNTTGTAAGLSANITESQVTNLTTDLAAKAPLASPALTGTPTAPTAVTTDSSTTIATTAFVKTAAGTQSIVDNEVPSGLVNSSNTVYTLASTPATNSLMLYKNGVRLKGGGADYTLSGNTITFVTAPATGAVLLADYNVSNTAYSVGTNSLITDEIPTGLVNSSNAAYSAARAYIAGSLEVFINGVKQARTTHFTETSPSLGTFTMGDAPTTGDNIIINYQFNLNPASNADTVDGIHASTTALPGQLVALDGSGHMPAGTLLIPGGTASQSSTLSTTTTGADIAGCTFTINPTVPSTVYVWFSARVDTSAAGNEIQVQLTDSVDGIKIAYTASQFDVFSAGSRIVTSGTLNQSYNIPIGSRTIKVQGISSTATTGNIQNGKLTYVVVSQ